MRNSLLHFCSKSWSGLFGSDGPMVFGVSDPGYVRSGNWLDSTATTNTAYQRNLVETTSAYHRRSSGHRFGNECVPRSHSTYIAWGDSLGRTHPPACRSHEGGRVLGISALCSNQHRTYFLVFLAGQEQLHSDQKCGEGWRGMSVPFSSGFGAV